MAGVIHGTAHVDGAVEAENQQSFVVPQHGVVRVNAHIALIALPGIPEEFFLHLREKVVGGVVWLLRPGDLGLGDGIVGVVPVERIGPKIQYPDDGAQNGDGLQGVGHSGDAVDEQQGGQQGDNRCRDPVDLALLDSARLRRHENGLKDEEAVLPLALKQPAVFFRHSPHALQAQAVALPLGDCRQAVRTEVDRRGAGIFDKEHQAPVFGQLQGELDFPHILGQVLAGVDGVFQGVAQNDAQVRLLKGELIRRLHLDAEGTAGV